MVKLMAAPRGVLILALMLLFVSLARPVRVIRAEDAPEAKSAESEKQEAAPAEEKKPEAEDAPADPAKAPAPPADESAPEDAAAGEAQAGAENGDLPAAAPAPRADVVAEQAKVAPAVRHVEVDPAALASVQDRVNEWEREPYYKILAHARDVSYEEQTIAARTFMKEQEAAFRANPKNARKKYSLFLDIIQNPDRFRGKPVRLHGYLHRLTRMDAGENDEGLTTLYQADMITGDSFSSPYVIVCSEIPPDIPLPRKGNATNDVWVTGFFFKLWSYKAERGNWGAPVIMAQRLEWKPPPPKGLSAEMKMVLGVGMAVGALVVVLFVVSRTRSQRAERQRRRELLSDPDDDNIDTLGNLERN